MRAVLQCSNATCDTSTAGSWLDTTVSVRVWERSMRECVGGMRACVGEVCVRVWERSMRECVGGMRACVGEVCVRVWER